PWWSAERWGAADAWEDAALVDGADTIAAPNPSDGNGVRPVSMAGAGGSVDPVGMVDPVGEVVGMCEGIGAAGECAGDPGARPSEFALRLPNKRPLPPQVSIQMLHQFPGLQASSSLGSSTAHFIKFRGF